MRKNIEKRLAGVSTSQLEQAEKLLKSDDMLSVKYVDDAGIGCFEAMIAYKGGILMPYLMVGEEHALVCQCEKKGEICVHKIALLLAARTMLEADCSDYHMALKMATAKTMETLFFRG